MPALSTPLRKKLEEGVKAARRIGEEAAAVSLERLHVGLAEPGVHLSPEERVLRNRLRAHGRQLGDRREPKTGKQSTDRLIHECAYEHWHRMLFARFLAENLLLMHPDGVAVTLEECEELAADEGAPDGWALAGRYAAGMLPQIFRPDDPVLQVGFAPEHKRALEKLVNELPGEVFTAQDSLGWVYQFWQAERKDEVNRSGDKITGETLPAVTQLFTEHYMVLFLLHNTIGAWWAARLRDTGRVTQAEWDQCQTEDDCRKLVALPGYDFTYLRFVRDDVAPSETEGDQSLLTSAATTDGWRPAGGTFPSWPQDLKAFKLVDPCCGSGHFLVAAFELLVRLRMADGGLAAKDACDLVLSENLHGLELDPRCTQIAAFALALTAWKFTDGFRPLPPMNIACSGLGVNARKEDWLALANGDTRLRSGLEQLYDLFQKAPELGSLINPRQLSQGDLVTASFAELQPLLTKALQSEKARKNDELNEIGVAAQGMAKAATLLSSQYEIVVTNVPYLVFKKQGEVIKRFCERFAADAKMDLATIFLVRCLDFTATGGTTTLVTPQNWLFLGSYMKLRERLLSSVTWDWVTRLGPGAFETVSGEIVNAALLSITRKEVDGGHSLRGIDVSASRSTVEKAHMLRIDEVQTVNQSSQLQNPDGRLSFDVASSHALLSKYAISMRGIVNGDNDCWLRCFWEIPIVAGGWQPLQTTVKASCWFGGRELIINWSKNGEGMLRPGTENQAYGKNGVAISRMGEIKVTLYTGELYDQAVATIVPNLPAHLPAIAAYCASPQYASAVRKIDQSLKVTNASLIKVPFDLAHWQRMAAEEFPNGLPKPSSNDVTQSLFAGHPADSTAPLQVGVARMLGYRWPRQTGSSFTDCPAVGPDGLEKLADDDGIACLPSVRGEQPAAERLRELLIAAYGKEWSPSTLEELLTAAGAKSTNLEAWLRNEFFPQHCKLFHKRPFIWQIWDGRKDGFSALVNYHQLDHKLLEKLTYTYLGDWIKRQQDAVNNEESGADDRLLKARQLQDQLKLILAGDAPFDIFVRWKALEQQPIGWHPDLNDGVRLNIRPFMEADILRKRPNIHWKKDRGKNPPGSPWGEERHNDRHLTLEEKLAARADQKQQ